MAQQKKLGIFPWYSLYSSAPQTTAEFFKTLLGVTTSEFEIPGQGKATILTAGKTGYADVTKEKSHSANHWTTFITVENVDNFLTRAKKLGGTVVKDTFEIPTIGFAAIVKDPCGATFAPYTPHDWAKNSSVVGMEQGQICWNELIVNDPKKVLTFYAESFGWKFTKSTEMGEMEYHAFTTHDGQQVGGVMKATAQIKDMTDMWTPYLATTNIEATTKKVTTLGGKVRAPIMEIPKTGRFSVIQEPKGALCYLFQNISK